MSAIFYNPKATGKGDGSTPENAFTTWDEVIEERCLGASELWVKPKKPYGAGERMANALKISGRIYAGIVVMWSVLLWVLLVSIDMEEYGRVVLDLFAHVLVMILPLMVVSIVFGVLRMMNDPYKRKLIKSQSELLEMSNRIVVEVINAKRKRDGGKGYEGKAEFTPDEWDEIWHACRSGRPE